MAKKKRRKGAIRQERILQGRVVHNNPAFHNRARLGVLADLHVRVCVINRARGSQPALLEEVVELASPKLSSSSLLCCKLLDETTRPSQQTVNGVPI